MRVRGIRGLLIRDLHFLVIIRDGKLVTIEETRRILQESHVRDVLLPGLGNRDEG